MNPNREELLELALKLPPEDQIRLAEDLFAASQEDEGAHLHPSWEAEIKRRMDEHKPGKTPLKAWREVMDALDERAREHPGRPDTS